MTNLSTLQAGAWDDKATTRRIDVKATGTIDMGSVVFIENPFTEDADNLLARVTQSTVATDKFYGIAVEGDTDGIFGTGAVSTDDTTRATNAANQGVTIVTAGRTPARVDGSGTPITTGLELAVGPAGNLVVAIATDRIVAVALQDSSAVDIIVVDVQREGEVT